MDIKQIIFWDYDTAITDGVTRSIQLRIMLESRDPYKGVRRGLWDSGTDYEVDDFVYTVASGIPTRWYCIQANHGNDPTTVGSLYWTKADHFEWAYDDPTKVLIIPGLSRRIVGRPSPISAHPTKEQGKLTPESFEITMLDFFELLSSEGAVDGNGNPVAIDWRSTAWKSFLNQVFSNNDALTTWHWLQIIDNTVTYSQYADKTKFDMYWEGDSQNSKNSTPEEIVFAEEGENALQVQQVRVTVDSFQARASSYTVRDFLDVTKESDYIKYAFFGNYAANEGETIPNDNYGAGLPARLEPPRAGGILESLGLVGPATTVLMASIAANTINDKLHYATYEELIVLMFAVMGWTTDPTKWSSNIQPWGDKTNQTTYKIESERVGFYTDHTWMATTGVCFEQVFSCDPRCDWTVQEASFSTGSSWDTPLSGVLEKWARTWVCKFESTYDQTLKQPSVLLRDLFEAAVLVSDAATSGITTGDATIAVTDAAAIYAASDIIEITDGLNTEYAIATAGSGTTLTITRPDPIAFATGAIVNAIQTVPSARSGRGNWGLSKSIREQQTISAGHVEVKAATDDDILGSPHLRGEALSIEMAQRTKAFAPIDSVIQFKKSYETYNGNLEADKQGSTWRSFAGGRQARHIIPEDATVTLLNNSLANVNLYTVQSNSSTFWYLNRFGGDISDMSLSDIGDNVVLKSWWDDPSSDVVCFPNGAFGVVIGNVGAGGSGAPDGWTVDGLNTIVVGVNQFQSINPATGTNQKITVGFEPAESKANNVAFNSFHLSAGLKTATVTGDLSGQSMFKNDWKGMQFVFPKYGIFTLESVSYSAGTSTCTFDRSFPVTDNAAYARVGGPSLNPDCMIGAYMYYENSIDKRYNPRLYDGSNTHRYFEMFMSHTNVYPPTAGFFSGAYTVSRLSYGLPEGTQNPSVPIPPDDNHGCESYTAAQVYAELYIGNFTQVTRHYNGVTYSDGLISSVRNGMMWYEYREGAVRFYQVLGRDIDPFSLGRGQTVLHCIEKKPRRNIHRNKVWVKGRNTSSGGANGVGGASGVEGSPSSGPSSTGTTDLGAAVLTKPATVQRNRIKSALDGVLPLEVQRRFSSNTDNLFTLWESDGTTTLSAFDYHGNLYLRQGALTGPSSAALVNSPAHNNDIDVSTYASYLIAGPTGAFDITGFAKPLLDGTAAYRLPITIVNNVAQTLTLKNNDSNSAAGNRLRIPGGDATILQHESFTIQYDLTNSEWVVTSITKAPISLTNVVVTNPTATQTIQPTVAGAVALRVEPKAGDGANSLEVYTNGGTLAGRAAPTGELDWNYTIYIAPVIDAVGIDIDKGASDSTDAFRVKLTGSTTLRITKDGNVYGFDFHGATFYGTTLNLNGSATSLDITSTATAASNTSVISIANSGTGGRGQFNLNTNGTVTFGPQDKNSGLTKGFAISGNLSSPVHTITAAGPTQLDGAYHFVILNTASNNVTVKLPAHSTNGGPEIICYKSSVNNTATVQDSAGTAVKAWTAGNTGFTFKDDGATWRPY